jgi:serine/threonine-protein kinase
MPIEHRIRQLVEEALNSGRSPDEVCRDCPELLGEVRREWERVRVVEAEMDALFPGPDGPPPDDAAFRDEETGLPRIEGYDVEAVLGQGGMGVVYRARHRKLNRLVALKMILAGAYARPPDRARFQREAVAVAALRHPHVVQVYDSGEAGGRPYFTMEFVEGGTLADKLAGTPLAARPAADLVAALAGAVQAAHASGVVHRDLKPANVLLTADGTPKVTDFGLARYVEGGPELTLSGTRVGTPSYMAPEQVLGRSRAIGPATDVYSMGAILYELLTGRPPIRGESAAETERQVIDTDPVPPARLNARVPRDLETICLKCLHKEPHRRYASAAALADDLNRFLRGDAVAARPEGRLRRLIRQLRRRPVFSTALAAGLLCVTALVGGGLCLAYERAADASAAEADRAAIERAANEDLQEMVGSLKKSAWPAARAALERARGRLGDGGSVELRRLLDQGKHDLEVAARLGAIRLNIIDSADGQYEEAFREFGQVAEDTDVVAARIEASNIRNALVAALDHWSVVAPDSRRWRWVLEVARKADPAPTSWRARARDPDFRKDPVALAQLIATAPIAGESVSLLLALEQQLSPTSPEREPFLKRLRQAHPGDFWVNFRLGSVLNYLNKPEEAVGYFRVALAARPGSPRVRTVLGLALIRTGRDEEGVEECRQAVRLDPTRAVYQVNLCVGLFFARRFDEAIKEFPAAIRMNPNDALLHNLFGFCLETKGQFDEALTQHREAIALDPNRAESQREFRRFLMRRGQVTEAQVAWRAAIEANPLDHATHYGYTEFCLFLGQEDEYRRARRALLDKFGTTSDRHVAARTARACLLLPATEVELRKAAALAERAAAVASEKKPTSDPYFLFVRGLAEYRQGRLDPAIATMRGEASRMLGPAPRLVLALALHRKGRVEEARRALAAAVMAHDWRATGVLRPEQWVLHVLRREAEAAILPDLPAFLDGKYQPRDNDERLALLGVCQFTNRSLALTRLYTDAFAADPNLAGDFRSGLRFGAARAAALVGCGRGEDAAGVGEPERARWRQQARQWLRADLAACHQALDRDPATARNLWPIPMWRADPDLAGFFEPAELDKLPPDERKDCAALSKELSDLLARARGTPQRTGQ